MKSLNRGLKELIQSREIILTFHVDIQINRPVLVLT